MKPLSTLNRPVLGTVDVVTKESAKSFKERTDVTAVPAMGVVAETMVALVLAQEAQRKFGGDSIEEFRRNYLGYLASLGDDPLGGRRPSPMVDRLVLIGMMGAGKTTVGRMVAARLGWGYLDSDEQVMAATGCTVAELFAERGEAAFRAEEARVLAEALGGSEPVVVSAAGGVVLAPANRALLPGRARWCGCGPTRPPWPVGWGAVTIVRCSATTRRRRWWPSTPCVGRSTPSWPRWSIDVDELSAGEVVEQVMQRAGLTAAKSR